MERTVSIIIPTFNRAQKIVRAVESAIAEAQACDADIIVVDDGSTDDTRARLASFGSRVRYYYTANSGVGAARNFGLAQTQSAFVRFLDSDDEIVSGSSARLIAAARTYGNAVIGVCGDRASDETIRPSRRYGMESRREGSVAGADLLRGAIPLDSIIFPRQALIDATGFDPAMSFGEDYELTTRLWLAGLEFTFVDVMACIIDDHTEDRLSRSPSPHAFAAWTERMAALSEKLPAGDSAASVQFARFMWSTGRTAARIGYEESAHALFRIARSLAGSHAYVARRAMRLAYSFLDPYFVERVLLRYKWMQSKSK